MRKDESRGFKSSHGLNNLVSVSSFIFKICGNQVR